MQKALLCIALLLTACKPGDADSASAPPAAESQETKPAEAPAPAPEIPSAKPRLVDMKSDLLDFTYGWPAEAAAIPALAARLEADMARDREEALATAREDKESRGPDFPFNGHYLDKVWKTAGDTPRLLSLSALARFFTGGAHGNGTYDAILWDRKEGRAIEPLAVFADSRAAAARLSETYCHALDVERAKRRGVDLPLEKEEDWMSGCPPIADQVVALVDTNGDGRFDALRVLLPPYEAGPYVEGTYEIDTPMTDALRNMVKPDYKAAF